MAQVVTYRVDDATTVKFEIEPSEGFRPAGPEEVLGRVREAVGPAVEAAKAVLEKVKEARPDEVELKFGIKVSGGANWLVAKAAGEANFEVTLTWSRPVHRPGLTPVRAAVSTSSPAQPPAADRWVAAVHASEDDFEPLGTAVVIDADRVLTCAHVVMPEGAVLEPLWVAFPKAGDCPRRRVASVTGRVLPAGEGSGGAGA